MSNDFVPGKPLTSEYRLWRTEVRAVALQKERGLLRVVVPAWDSSQPFDIPLSDIPSEYHAEFEHCRNRRFFARANTGIDQPGEVPTITGPYGFA